MKIESGLKVGDKYSTKKTLISTPRGQVLTDGDWTHDRLIAGRYQTRQQLVDRPDGQYLIPAPAPAFRKIGQAPIQETSSPLDDMVFIPGHRSEPSSQETQVQSRLRRCLQQLATNVGGFLGGFGASQLEASTAGQPASPIADAAATVSGPNGTLLMQ